MASKTTAAAAAPAAALDASEDEDGRDLGVERDVPGDDHEGPELADGLRERDAAVGEDDAAERRRPGGAERMRRLLELGIELLQDRLHRADDERQRHEHHRENDRRPREGHVDADR